MQRKPAAPAMPPLRLRNQPPKPPGLRAKSVRAAARPNPWGVFHVPGPHWPGIPLARDRCAGGCTPLASRAGGHGLHMDGPGFRRHCHALCTPTHSPSGEGGGGGRGDGAVGGAAGKMQEACLPRPRPEGLGPTTVNDTDGWEALDCLAQALAPLAKGIGQGDTQNFESKTFPAKLRVKDLSRMSHNCLKCVPFSACCEAPTIDCLQRRPAALQ